MRGDFHCGGAEVVASPGTPYIRVDSGPNGTETDLLSNLHEIEHPSSFVQYVQIKDDRDNREDLILQINSDPQQPGTDLLSNQPEDELDSQYESFVKIEDDRDNRDDLISHV